MKSLLLSAILLSFCGAVARAEPPTGIFPGPPRSKEVRSGFYGQAFVFGTGGPVAELFPPPAGHPYTALVSVYDRNGKLLRRTRTNPVGQFYLFLQPGEYTLLGTALSEAPPPRDLRNYRPPEDIEAAVALPVVITVSEHRLTSVEIRFWSFHP